MRSRWGTEQAWRWYRRVHPICGCNYVPRTAVNSTAMWQAEGFDVPVIDQELGWAAAAGLNSLRVFLQYLVWAADPEGFKQRLDRFLRLAHRHGMSTMLVLFDDCSFSGRPPYLGPQDEPVPGVHNSGWTPSPGVQLIENPHAWAGLEAYVKDLVAAFGGDERVLAWDLYNEPGNSGVGERSQPLVEAAFTWAREVAAAQPLTTGVWKQAASPASRRLAELSDVGSFHYYDGRPGPELEARVRLAAGEGRPVLCTEWLHRPSGNTFDEVLPFFGARGIGWYVWGCVAGKTQTYMPWGSQAGSPVPAVWQHDLFHPDGTPYDRREIELIGDYRRAYARLN